VAVHCIKRKIWNGPTVLVAPAQSVLARYTLTKKPVLEPEDGIESLLIVHAFEDKVVPYRDSINLVRKLQPGSYKIEGVHDNHRLQENFNKTNAKRWVEYVSRNS